MKVWSHLALALVVSTAIVADTALANKAWEEVVSESEARVGSMPARALDPAVQQAIIGDLLADGLTRDEAVELALRNNNRLQAAFAKLGIADADLAQAGLHTNPTLDFLARFPGGESGSELEAELLFSLSDLWLLGPRQEVEQARLQQVAAHVVGDVLNTAADTRMAYDRCLVLESLVAQTAETAATVEKWRDQVYARYEHGYSSELELSMADAEVVESEVDLAEMKAEQQVARARLRRLLGLTDEHKVSLIGSLTDAPSAPPDLHDMTRRALAGRPDLQAARAGIWVADRALLLERHSRWEHVSFGPAYAHEPEGKDLWGIVLEVDLPIFDSNRAQQRRAAAELEQAERQIGAAEAMVREQVATAWEELALAHRRESAVREELLPARQRAFEHAQKYWREMQLNMLYLLEAQRELSDARRQHLEAVYDLRRAWAELEFAAGGKLAVTLPPAEAGD
jgi:cobalt-zinc-cadmium efflux system outer membrane protein